MSTIHTQIGSEFLPEEIADPNQLVNYYESYVLIPNMGPVVYAKLYKKLKFMVDDLSVAVNIIEATGKFKTKYNEIPSTPFIPEITNVAESHIKEGAATGELDIGEAYARPTKDRPEVVLKALKNAGTANMKISDVMKSSQEDYERLSDYSNILGMLSEKNAVISALAQDQLMLGKEGIIKNDLLASNKEQQVETIIKSFQKAKKTFKPSEKIEALGKSMSVQLLKDTPLVNYKNQISPLLSMHLANFFDIYGIADPNDHIKIAESCEWAFVRKERITIDLKKPLFRGPLNVNCVTPESELTLTQSESRMQTSVSGTLLKTSDDLKTYSSISSEVKSKLGTLFDYGTNLGQTMSEQGYTQDSMQSEKRSRVESAMSEISRQNSTYTLKSESLTSSMIREYRTEGKDPKYATSELSFEVFSPVEVKHYLEDIGAVWCPRIKNPFLGLRNSLNMYYLKTYFDYILENYVVDPMEPVPSYEAPSRVSKNTVAESNPGTFYKYVTFSLTTNEIKAGYFFGEDIRLEFYQHCDYYENCYDEDDYRMEVISTNRHGGDSRVDVTVKYKVDKVFGNNPDVTYIIVSIDKYKETDSYRQERLQYKQTVTKTNPARRNAVKVQARKYATLKRDELIRKHQANADLLKDFAFTSLIKKMFDNNLAEGNWSYYQGIIRNCIDWEKSRMEPEASDVASLYENELSPYHFLNVPAVRFFLNIRKDAEEVFFDTMKKVVDSNWKSLFDKVENYIKQQRKKFKESPEDKKLLDQYDSELILGRHLEAILSNSTFSE